MNPCANQKSYFLDTAYLSYESRERYNLEVIHPDMSVTEYSLCSQVALLTLGKLMYSISDFPMCRPFAMGLLNPSSRGAYPLEGEKDKPKIVNTMWRLEE